MPTEKKKKNYEATFAELDTVVAAKGHVEIIFYPDHIVTFKGEDALALIALTRKAHAAQTK